MPRRFVSLGAVVALAAAWMALGAAQASAAGTVTVSVVGQASVTGEGVDCTQSGGPDCSQFYANECEPNPEPPPPQFCFPPTKEFTAGADTNGFVFNSWSGCDDVTERVCSLTVDTSSTITASFRDAQAPSVSGVSPASGTQRGTFTIGATATDNAGVSRVEFRVRGALVATDTSAPFSTSFDSTGVADGTAVLRATGFDAAGNASFAESTVTIDNTAPETTIESKPRSRSTRRRATFTFAASEAGSTFECQLDGGAYQACAATKTYRVARGRHVLRVRATDQVGNVDATPARWAWKVVRRRR